MKKIMFALVLVVMFVSAGFAQPVPVTNSTVPATQDQPSAEVKPAKKAPKHHKTGEKKHKKVKKVAKKDEKADEKAADKTADKAADKKAAEPAK
ncbi:MAG: hypothetical protein HQL18_05130 [Candidatus Omnitrophica bacterium]|nr:hypothetical protein [Candidatus Omnitrophota bacterium]